MYGVKCACASIEAPQPSRSWIFSTADIMFLNQDLIVYLGCNVGVNVKKATNLNECTDWPSQKMLKNNRMYTKIEKAQTKKAQGS